MRNNFFFLFVYGMMRIVNDDYVAQCLRGKVRESESTLIVYRLSKGPNRK